MFDKSHCSDCENIDCLTRCQWMDIDKETARIEMEKMSNGEDSFVLKQCVTCYACDEYCPYNSHPFDLKTELQEKYSSLNIDPELLNKMIKQFEPPKELRIKEIDPNKLVFHKCTFSRMNEKEMKGLMFENLQYISGRAFFCNLQYHHLAKDSIIRERLPIIMENIKEHGIKELICWHDECYGLWTSYCQRNNIEVPFKPIHLFEYVYNYLKEHESEITKLNMKIAYQRSCSNRFISETDKWVDKICDLIGLERVARKYDRENALCCAGAFGWFGKGDLTRPTQNKNVKDMVKHDAEACVYNCPMCQNVLGSKVERKGLKNYLLSDLARMALGEELNY
ncbi:MAG: (Fe-S)-binding protein [Candidatus Lokiarchaeota archaeon]|nr:(Fe-S)-binding protein [Candidatus Lokiarchaeota archaeon]